MSRIHEKKVTFELFENFFRGVTKIFHEFYTDLESTQKIIKNTLGKIFLKINFLWSEGPITGPGSTLGEDNISTNTTENDDTTMERRPKLLRYILV